MEKSPSEWMELGESFTMGTCLGFCSGYALKKVGRAAAVAVGGLVVIFQSAARQGYVEVKWDAIERDFNNAVDFNQDGKVDASDARHAWGKALDVLTDHMGSAGAGFAAGMLLGLRRG